MSDARPLYGLVLAGGRSRRMGSDKALLEKDGQTQLARMVSLLGRYADRVFVSARADQADEPERRKFEQIVDRYDDLGPVAGVLSAMEAHAQADWLVVACDLPNVDDATLTTLLEARDPEQTFVAYASSRDGLPEPLCAIYARGAKAVIRDFVADGIRCPRKMMIRSQPRLLVQPHPAALDNVNRPEDLADSGARIAR